MPTPRVFVKTFLDTPPDQRPLSQDQLELRRRMMEKEKAEEEKKKSAAPKPLRVG